MRPVSLLLPASLLVLATSAGAQTLPYPRTDAEPMSSVQVTGPARTVRIPEDQAEKIGGSYAMSNGWRLKVKTGSRHIDATIDSEKPLRLLAVAPYRFVAADGNVTMDFNQGAWGDDMTMSYIPEQAGLAQRVVISTAIAQR